MTTTTTTPDPWPAIDELAELLNQLATRLAIHDQQIAGLTTQPTGGDPEPTQLEEWVRALTDQYGLHAQLGQWKDIPPLRAELVALMVADVRGLDLKQGSFELVYWHDALARVVGRAQSTVDRWRQDQQNRRLLLQSTVRPADQERSSFS